MSGLLLAPAGRSAVLVGVLVLLALWHPGEAAADNPRFTVKNQHSETVHVLVFTGNDATCVFEEKRKTVKSGAEKSMGCQAQESRGCMALIVRKGESVGCRQSSEVKKCGKRNVMKLADNQTLTVLDGASDCVISGP